MATPRRTQDSATQARADARQGAMQASATGGPSQAQIAERAYQIWKANGCPAGRDREHWFQAERELRTTEPPSRNTARR